jgi:hypothetical protein
VACLIDGGMGMGFFFVYEKLGRDGFLCVGKEGRGV